MGAEHPYIPRDLDLPGFVPITISQSDVLVPYIGTSLLVVLLVWLISGTVPYFVLFYNLCLLMC